MYHKRHFHRLLFAFMLGVLVIAGRPLVNGADAAVATYRRLSLMSLEFSGRTIQPGPIPTVAARPGEAIAGSFTVLYEHDYAESQVCPLAVTPNWGDRTTVYWQAADDMVNGGEYTSAFDLVAPDSIGTYYLIIASHNEYNAGQIVSATHWSTNWDPVWNDGNDLYDWDETTLETAASTGEVVVPYLNGTGTSNVAACVIRIAVTNQYRQLLFQNITLNDQELDPALPVIQVESGAAIVGSADLLFQTNVAASNVFPLVGIPTWGDRQTNYWSVAGDMNPGSTYTSAIDLTAPTDPGIYYLLFATQSEYNAEQVASATHWSFSSTPIWYNGDDLVDWSQDLIDEAVATGTVLAPYYQNMAYFGAQAIRIEVGAVPDLHRRLELVSLSVRDLPVDVGNPLLRAHPGQNITGAFTVRFQHDYPESHVYPLAAVPTWLDAETGYWQVADDMQNGGEYTGQFDLTVPEEAGDYYLILASHNEYNAGQIASATHWSYQWDPVWDDGNDLRDWSQAEIDSAMATGEVTVPYLNNVGESNVAACAIRIHVSDEFRQLDLVSATVNGQALDPAAPSVQVQPGEVLAGSFSVHFSTNYPSSHVFPLMATPTWGDRTQDYWQVAGSMSNGGTYSGSLDLVAPRESGVYYVIMATHSEYDAGQVASATHWSSSSTKLWNNGDDVVDWPEPVISEAMTNGSVFVPFYKIGTTSVGACAIRIEVQVPELLVTMTPQADPVTIPATGGRFTYDVSVENTTATDITADVVVEAVLPNGNFYPVLTKAGITFPAESTITRNSLSQDVPQGAPAGSYIYRLSIIGTDGHVIDFDEFNFEKLGSIQAAKSSGDWMLKGWDESVAGDTVAGAFTLAGGFPNPFNPMTTVRFALAQQAKVNLRIYDLRGQLVKTLIQGRSMPAGSFSETWHGDDDHGRTVGAGVYLLRLQAGDFEATQRVTMIK